MDNKWVIQDKKWDNQVKEICKRGIVVDFMEEVEEGCIHKAQVIEVGECHHLDMKE